MTKVMIGIFLFLSNVKEMSSWKKETFLATYTNNYSEWKGEVHY